MDALQLGLGYVGGYGGLGMRDANREGERGEVVYWSRVRR